MDNEFQGLNLVKFTGIGSKVSRKISINKSFGFSVPKAFLAENKVENPKFVDLFYDQNLKVIGLFFKSQPDSSGFKLVPYGHKGERLGFQFSAKSFFNTYNIPVDKVAGHYEAYKQALPNEGDIFLIKIVEKQEMKVQLPNI